MNTILNKKIEYSLRTIKQFQEDIEVQKRKRDDDYGDHRALILNLTKLSKNVSRENKMIIDEGINLLGDAKKNNDQLAFDVKELVVNLTEMHNELKKLESLPKDQDEAIQEIKKTLRYTVTAIKNCNRQIKEIQDKRAQFEQQLEDSEYYSELERIEAEYEREKQELAKKYDVEVLQKISEQEMEISNNASQIEDDAKDIIREIRSVIKETYHIPEKIIDEVKISLRAFGALATISKNAPRLSMKKKGILKIMNDPKLFKILGEFIKITEYSEKVQIANAAMPKMRKYFLELKTKMEEEVEDLEKNSKKAEKQSKEVNENVVTDITEKVLTTVTEAVKEFFSDLKDKFSVFKTKVEGVYQEVRTTIKEFNSEHTKTSQELSISFIELDKFLKKAEIDYATDIEKQIK